MPPETPKTTKSGGGRAPGYVKTYRQLLSSDEIGHDLEMLGAWTAYLLSAAYDDCVVQIGGKRIQVPAGSFIWTQRGWAKKYEISVDKARRIRISFERLGMIQANQTKDYTMISIVNWSKYQQNDQPQNPPQKQPQKQPPVKQDKESHQSQHAESKEIEQQPQNPPQSQPQIPPLKKEYKNKLYSVSAEITEDQEEEILQALQEKDSEITFVKVSQYIDKNASTLLAVDMGKVLGEFRASRVRSSAIGLLDTIIKRHARTQPKQEPFTNNESHAPHFTLDV